MMGFLKRWGAFIALVLAIVVLSGVLARALSRARVAEGEVQRQREAATLAAQHFAVAAQDAEMARAEGQRLLASDEKLRAEFDRLKRAAPGVRVVTIREGLTPAVKAGGEPVQVAPGLEKCDPCLVPAGATLMAHVKSLDATTDRGNLVALMRVQVERLTPPPPTVLFDDMVTSEGSFVTAPAPPVRARFSLGGGAWWKNPGWTAEIRGGLRVAGSLWAEAAGRFDNQYQFGVRWEIQ